jgi:hypothetical protein
MTERSNIMTTTTDELVEGELVPDLADTVAPAPITLFGTDNPNAVIAKATEISNGLARVIRDKGLFASINGKEYVLVEGWTLLGSMLGLFPYTVWTRPLEDGWEARVEARSRDGNAIAAAEAECLRAERKWARSDDYAVRSMAQTRATSKALRLPLGFVMQLAGFEATPADEMPVASEPAPRREPGPESQPWKPTDEQWQEVRTLIRTLERIEPDTDWAGWCREASGGLPAAQLTRGGVDILIRRLQEKLTELAHEET